MRLTRVLLATMTLALPGLAMAESLDLAGHKIEISETDDFAFQLTVDGKAVLTDGLIRTENSQELDGGAVLIGVAGAGGNACDAAPFALWLPKEGAPRLDGPIDSCSYLISQVVENGIQWSSPSLPGRLTEHWLWTAEGGMQARPATPFAPDAGKDWSSLPALADQHPAEALRLVPVYDALIAGLGDAEFQKFGERISDLGSGGLQGADYYGEACIKEVCDTDFAGIWLDAAQQKVFAFWRDETGMHRFPENLAEWPAGAVARFKKRGA